MFRSFTASIRSLRVSKPWAKTACGFFGVLAVAGLASCGNVNGTLSPEALRQRGLKPGEGLIVGSFVSKGIDRSGKSVNGTVIGTQVMGKSVDGEPSLRFSILPNPTSDLFAIPVPAGNYEITGWMITAMGFNATITARNRLPMKVPFQVRAGEAVYVGRMNALSIYGKNLLGMQVFGEGVILATDEFAKDGPRISKAYPEARKAGIRPSRVPALYRAEMKRTAETPVPWWQF